MTLELSLGSSLYLLSACIPRWGILKSLDFKACLGAVLESDVDRLALPKEAPTLNPSFKRLGRKCCHLLSTKLRHIPDLLLNTSCASGGLSGVS